jgi:hypothetical protein
MRCSIPFLTVFLAVVPALAGAESREAPMQVSAYVVPRASLEATSAPATVQVTAADVAVGYKDVAATYRVRTNDPRGYFLRFATRAGLTQAVEVTGLAAPVLLEESGTDVLQQHPSRDQVYSLGFRLRLAPGAAAGTYELPVVVRVASL